MVQNLPANTGDLCLIPGSGRSPGGGNSYPLQYSCLEDSMHRGAWWARVHGVTKELGMPEQLSMHSEEIQEVLELKNNYQREKGVSN